MISSTIGEFYARRGVLHEQKEVGSFILFRYELRDAICLRICTYAQFGGKLIQKTDLPDQQPGSGNFNWEPCTAVDFRKFAHHTGFIWPLHRECVAMEVRWITITLKCPDLHELSASLLNVS
jgi:hypothetical protein